VCRAEVLAILGVEFRPGCVGLCWVDGADAGDGAGDVADGTGDWLVSHQPLLIVALRGYPLVPR
jgi:hypothetical protein